MRIAWIQVLIAFVAGALLWHRFGHMANRNSDNTNASY